MPTRPQLKVTVRRARLEDAGSLAALCTQLGYPSSPSQIGRRLRRIERDEDHAVLVAELATGQVAGWIHACVRRVLERETGAEIAGLVVGEKMRGAGVGQALVERAEQWAGEKACGHVTVRSNVVRAGAHAFYERLGYKTIKTQRVFHKQL